MVVCFVIGLDRGNIIWIMVAWCHARASGVQGLERKMTVIGFIRSQSGIIEGRPVDLVDLYVGRNGPFTLKSCACIIEEASAVCGRDLAAIWIDTIWQKYLYIKDNALFIYDEKGEPVCANINGQIVERDALKFKARSHWLSIGVDEP